MANINPNDIENISVLKSKAAIAIYGDKGVNGVILIETKKEPVYTDVTIIDDNNKDGLKLRTDGNLDFGQENTPAYLYIKDGVEITKEEVEKIHTNTIQSIEVLKGKVAKEKYGKKGVNGVIVIESKNDKQIYVTEKKVHGIVTDEAGDPIPGANVIIKGTTSGTVTDKNGNYLIKVQLDNDVLIFAHLNFQQKEVEIEGKSKIDVTLKTKN